MTGIVLHDSNRSGWLTWALAVIAGGTATGVVLDPFSTPLATIPRVGRKPGTPGAADARTRLTGAGAEVYFDPSTHGVFVPGADLFDFYDSWDLWPGSFRGTASDAALAAHVDAIMTRCSDLGLRPIAPTLQLVNPTGPAAESANRMAELALATRPDAFVSIIGTTDFWSAGGRLDAYIGELVQLRPGGWYVGVARNALRYPWPSLDASEVEGICRTVHSLSMRGANVLLARADLSGLPGIAAGGTLVGSGWDMRHRVLADEIFRRSSGVRRASPRVSHSGLLASLKRVGAESLLAADPALSNRLVPGALPVAHNDHWLHHLHVLRDRVDHVAAGGDRPGRVAQLQMLYADAAVDFDAVVAAAGRLEADRRQWIDPFAAGLDRYAADEGW